jgi:hypothetical protein
LSKSLTCLTHALCVSSTRPLCPHSLTHRRGVLWSGVVRSYSSQFLTRHSRLLRVNHASPPSSLLDPIVERCELPHAHTPHAHTPLSLPLTKFSLRQLTNSIVLPAVTMRQIQVTDYVTINPKTEVTVDKRVITVKGKSFIAPPAHTLAHSLLFLRVPFVFASCRASNYVQCRGKC